MRPPTPPLLNTPESRVYDIVSAVASANGARAFPKPRVADCLSLDHLDLTPRERSYSLKSHFDVVVTDDKYQALFAVEFDGRMHEIDPVTKERDGIKNRLCTEVGFPILRITSEYLEAKFRRFTLLEWLADLWFLEDAFYKAQERGAIPADEPFLYFTILADSTEELREKGWTCPYDLSLPGRLFNLEQSRRGRCIDQVPSTFTVDDADGYSLCLSRIRLNEEYSVLATSRVRNSLYSPVGSGEIAKELSMIAVCRQLRKALQGSLHPVPASRVRDRLRSMRELAKRSGTHCFEGGLDWDD